MSESNSITTPDQIIIYTVRGPDGLSPTLTGATEFEARMKMNAVIDSYPKADRGAVAATLSVVPVRLVEVKPEQSARKLLDEGRESPGDAIIHET